MIYFEPIPETLEALKQQYRKLSFKHHPDVGGSEEKMKVINREYTELFNELKNRRVSPDDIEVQREFKETPERMIVLMNRLLKAQKWVDMAQEDYNEAEYAFQSMDVGEFDAIWELCNKAAKKYIISLLVFKNVSFPKVCTLPDLVDLCETEAKIGLSFMYTKCSELMEKSSQMNEYTGYYIEKDDAKHILKDIERMDAYITSYYHEILNRNIYEPAKLENRRYLPPDKQ